MYHSFLEERNHPYKRQISKIGRFVPEFASKGRRKVTFLKHRVPNDIH